jgi:hypothetical protein
VSLAVAGVSLAVAGVSLTRAGVKLAVAGASLAAVRLSLAGAGMEPTTTRLRLETSTRPAVGADASEEEPAGGLAMVHTVRRRLTPMRAAAVKRLSCCPTRLSAGSAGILPAFLPRVALRARPSPFWVRPLAVPMNQVAFP